MTPLERIRTNERPLSWGGNACAAAFEGVDNAALLAAAKKIPTNRPAEALRLLAAMREPWSAVAVGAAASVLARLDAAGVEGVRRTKVYVVGNATLKPLADGLRVGLLGGGVAAEVVEGAFDNWAGELLADDSELYKFQPSFVVVYLSSLGLTTAATRVPVDPLPVLDAALANLRRKTAAQAVLVLPEPLEEEGDPSSPWCGWRAELIAEMRRRFAGRAVMIDPCQTIMKLGRAAWCAARYWYHAKLPCHPNALATLGADAAVTLARCLERPVKVVACDLDNVMWGGVAGEDGWSGLRLDVFGDGGPFIRLQAFLKSLIDTGVILIAVSKNNESDVREVFEKSGDLLIKYSDFTMVLANWDEKSKNLAKASTALAIKLDNFCFLDDQPFEREEVRRALPEVIVPELPVAPEDYVPFLVRSGLFQAPVVTSEDRKRHEYYKTEMERGDAGAAGGDMDGFLASLNIVAVAHEISVSNLDRVVQLINKTNQFNLMTKRHDNEAVRRFAEDPQVFSYCYSVSDRFGDSGVTGVFIAVPHDDDPDAYVIDTWLLSCRVMNRTIEKAMFAHLTSWLCRQGVRRLLGRYAPTAKNAPVAGLLGGLGFQGPLSDDGEAEWRCYDIVDVYDDNRFVKLACAGDDGVTADERTFT